MEKNVLYKGTKIEFEAKINSLNSKIKYILAESTEPDFVFQIICDEGYNAGNLCGFVKNDESINGIKGVTKKHLLNELKRNFLGFKIRSFRIIG